MNAKGENNLSLEYDTHCRRGRNCWICSSGRSCAAGAPCPAHRRTKLPGRCSTSGGVSEWFASLEGMGNIFNDLLWELDQSGGRFNGKRLFNPEHLKITWQHLADQAGVDILFHTTVIGVESRRSVYPKS